MGKTTKQKSPGEEAHRGAGDCQHSYTLSIHALYASIHAAHRLYTQAYRILINQVVKIHPSLLDAVQHKVSHHIRYVVFAQWFTIA